MPELPEVETVRRQLQRKIIGKKIAKINVLHKRIEKTLQGKSNILHHKTFSKIDRVGKLMIFFFKENDDLYMLTHLKMTGQFFFVDKNKKQITGGGHTISDRDIKDLPNKHTRISFIFTDSSQLHFNDMRLFGYVKVVNKKELQAIKSKFGPEPIIESFDVDEFYKKIHKRQTSIKAVLLNQQIIAGLGNIYVDEALWRSRVRPMRRASKLTKKEVARLIGHARDVLNESIAVGGTTLRDFKDIDGTAGNFTNYLQVFNRQDKPCFNCGTIIKKVSCAGRGTHYCPKCQK